MPVKEASATLVPIAINPNRSSFIYFFLRIYRVFTLACLFFFLLKINGIGTASVKWSGSRPSNKHPISVKRASPRRGDQLTDGRIRTANLRRPGNAAAATWQRHLHTATAANATQPKLHTHTHTHTHTRPPSTTCAKEQKPGLMNEFHYGKN